ncbi:MAG: hypothetical protein QOG49_1682, partial [Frankiaceae bacterium]|nr:hypothetical protein [Frankiaceae bacterium]
PAKPAEPAKPTCSADELAAFLASVKAEAAKQGHHNKQGADRASGRAAEEQARAARKAAQACAAAKQHAAEVARKAAEEAKQEANRKARARKFQAIGVVDVTDGTAGTVTVFIKAGSPDLHSRKLAIKVTADTVIQLDGNTVALAGLVSGTFVSVHGVRTEGTLVAARINAATPGVDDEHDVSPTVAPSPEPTAAPETK